MDNIPYGYCHCGCGQKTNIAKGNNSSLGHIKGEPFRFIRSHDKKFLSGPNHPNWKGGIRVRSCGYKAVYSPNHPRAFHNVVMEHIVLAEKVLGKEFKLPHVVHHHTPEQLVMCEDQAYHLLLHQRQKAYENCGHASWRKCKYCKRYDDPKNLYINSGHVRHRACHAAAARKYKAKKRSEKRHNTALLDG